MSKEFSSSSTLNKGVKKLGREHNIDTLHPHAFRHSHVDLAFRSCKDGEEMKAVSQNISHSSILTTFKQYGNKTPRDNHLVLKRINKRICPPEISV
jgi:integrase